MRWPMLMKAGLQELPVATSRLWIPWPAFLEQCIVHLPTFTEPVQLKVEFMFTRPSSSAAASVMGLKVEPGS